jgi:hypothetical protein
MYVDLRGNCNIYSILLKFGWQFAKISWNLKQLSPQSQLAHLWPVALDVPLYYTIKSERASNHMFEWTFQVEIGFHRLRCREKVLFFFGWVVQEVCFKGPLHTWDWEPVMSTLQALALVDKVEPVQVRFTLTTLKGPTEWVCECKMDVKSNGSCFLVTWTIFKIHLL